MVTGEVIEENGRLLAYVTPGLLVPLPPPEDPRRRTFNLQQLVENRLGRPVPDLPVTAPGRGLDPTRHAAETALAQKIGAWAEFGADLLLGYEYRACLARRRRPPERGPGRAGRADRAGLPPACVDVRTRTILGRFGYHQIDPPYRLGLAGRLRRSPKSPAARRTLSSRRRPDQQPAGTRPVAPAAQSEALPPATARGMSALCSSFAIEAGRAAPAHHAASLRCTKASASTTLRSD
ncbi:hypothetical protein HBB16_09930 [Pseudonocardia sp. MCCB 268]|nr:hypothetical protein [Pseudonocardia cytotoxica]